MNETVRARILLAEDNPTIQAQIRGVLTQTGYDVVVMGDGDLAIAEIRRLKPQLVLLDLHMPRVGGIAVLETVRALHSPLELPIIVCTTDAADTTVERALELSANDYLIKPITPRTLIARVQLHLRLAELTLKLAQQEHTAAVAAMVVTYNHEINNPLTVAMASLQHLRSRPKLPAEIDEQVALAQKALERIADIVRRTREAALAPVAFSSYVGATQMVALPKTPGSLKP